MVTTREAWPEEFDRVVEFYRLIGYEAIINQKDAIVVSEEGGELCGAARLCLERGILVLRGVRVREEYQRQGIGTQLLRALVPVIRGRECFCIPHRYLRSFYGQIGFVEVDPAAAPPFLAERHVEYRSGGGLDVIIMRRPSTREIQEIEDAGAETRPVRDTTADVRVHLHSSDETRPGLKRSDIKDYL
ncbi:MAG: GNAT family N-acetyltransferase [Anaerolineae bacterium]|nr:GNAT family N-acetyltransferase [Anaerolineae bacterium]